MTLKHRICAPSATLAALCLPVLAAAAASISPSPSYTGNYTVSWTDSPGSGSRVYLAQRINAAAWTKTTVTGTTSKAFSAMAVANYSYKMAWRIQCDTRHGHRGREQPQ